jgi:hypothetical protein
MVELRGARVILSMAVLVFDQLRKGVGLVGNVEVVAEPFGADDVGSLLLTLCSVASVGSAVFCELVVRRKPLPEGKLTGVSGSAEFKEG